MEHRAEERGHGSDRLRERRLAQDRPCERGDRPEISPPTEADYHLTERETRILKMLVDGHHYKTAARELNISTSTVSFHLKNIYEKLQVHSKTEAVAKALREKII